MKLVSSRPRDSSETFLLGKLVGHHAKVLFANKMMTAVPWPGRNELCKTRHKIITCARVLIKFEVGSWLEKSNRLYEQEAVRPLNLGGSGGMLPQKI